MQHMKRNGGWEELSSTIGAQLSNCVMSDIWRCTSKQISAKYRLCGHYWKPSEQAKGCFQTGSHREIFIGQVKIKQELKILWQILIA